MKAKYISEFLFEKSTDIPLEISNLVLDIGSHIKKVLKLEHVPIGKIEYDYDNKQWIATFPNISNSLTLSQQDTLLKIIENSYPNYAKYISLAYTPKIKGLVLYLDSIIG